MLCISIFDLTAISARHADLNSVTVPGAASGWCTTVEQFGSGKLTMAQILAPCAHLLPQRTRNTF